MQVMVSWLVFYLNFDCKQFRTGTWSFKCFAKPCVRLQLSVNENYGGHVHESWGFYIRAP